MRVLLVALLAAISYAQTVNTGRGARARRRGAVEAVLTRRYKFEEKYNSIISSEQRKMDFLHSCNQLLSPVTCTDIRSGDSGCIVIVLLGTTTHISPLSTQFFNNGLSIETFDSLNFVGVVSYENVFYPTNAPTIAGNPDGYYHGDKGAICADDDEIISDMEECYFALQYPLNISMSIQTVSQSDMPYGCSYSTDFGYYNEDMSNVAHSDVRPVCKTPPEEEWTDKDQMALTMSTALFMVPIICVIWVVAFVALWYVKVTMKEAAEAKKKKEEEELAKKKEAKKQRKAQRKKERLEKKRAKNHLQTTQPLKGA